MKIEIMATADTKQEAWDIAHRLAETLRKSGNAKVFGVLPPRQFQGIWQVLVRDRRTTRRAAA